MLNLKTNNFYKNLSILITLFFLLPGIACNKDKDSNDNDLNIKYLFVHPSGDNDNLGTTDEPLKTIGNAILKVAGDEQDNEDEENNSSNVINELVHIHVAEGSYDETKIKMKNGVSLFGGFSSTNWNDRDPSQYITIINITGTDSSANILFDEIGNTTSLDGFTINGGIDDIFSKIIQISNSSPTINNNIINSVSGNGIFVFFVSSPVISNNTINITFGNLNNISAIGYIGIDTDSSVKVSNNTVKCSGKSTSLSSIANLIKISFDETAENIDVSISDNLIIGDDDSQFEFTGIYVGEGNPLSPPHVSIIDNTIQGGNDLAESNGIRLSSNIEVDITGNIIIPGHITNSNNSRGIFIFRNTTNINCTISNNSINGGITSYHLYSDSYGIYIDEAVTKIEFSITNNSITGGSSSNSTFGVYMNSIDDSNSININNNDIFGGKSVGSSYGIYTKCGTTKIIRNSITGDGTSDITDYSTGLYDSSSNTLIVNNILSGGHGESSTGVFLTSSENSPVQKIYNNTILGGNHSGNLYTTGIYINSTNPVIENNIIYNSTGANLRLGISQSNIAPASVKNNSFSGCSDCDLYMYGTSDPIALYGDIASMEALSSNFSGNTDLVPVFEDADGADNEVSTFNDNVYSLTSATHINILQGGRDLSSVFIDDISGKVRTADTSGGPTNLDAGGWSIGAYEKD